MVIVALEASHGTRDARRVSCLLRRGASSSSVGKILVPHTLERNAVSMSQWLDGCEPKRTEAQVPPEVAKIISEERRRGKISDDEQRLVLITICRFLNLLKGWLQEQTLARALARGRQRGKTTNHFEALSQVTGVPHLELGVGFPALICQNEGAKKSIRVEGSRR
jgi:hypothetical protein